MMLDSIISDVRTWLMLHHVRSETVIFCVAAAVALGLILLRFFRPPRE